MSIMPKVRRNEEEKFYYIKTAVTHLIPTIYDSRAKREIAHGLRISLRDFSNRGRVLRSLRGDCDASRRLRKRCSMIFSPVAFTNTLVSIAFGDRGLPKVVPEESGEN